MACFCRGENSMTVADMQLYHHPEAAACLAVRVFDGYVVYGAAVYRVWCCVDVPLFPGHQRCVP